jgi:RsmE family RNA methyltransferase
MNILLLFPSELIAGSGGHYLLKRDDSRAVHVERILKLNSGDKIRAGIANGPAGFARILEMSDSGLLLGFEPEAESSHPHVFSVELLVGQVRPICAKRILREAAMLGVSVISFTGTDLGEKSYREAGLWSSGEAYRYILDGVVQAGATQIPLLRLFDDVRSCLEADTGPGPGGENMSRIVLDNVSEGVPLASLSGRLPAVIAIGSERGWSGRERNLFREGGWQFARLGARILRTETACAAALSIMLADFR